MITIVIPVLNERESLRPLMKELYETMEEVGRPYEVIFVNDGSSDGSRDEIRGLLAEHDEVRLLNLGRNRGKSVAYKVAFAKAEGDIIATMDADLQDVPAELPRLLQSIEDDDADLVIGWKQGRLGNEPSKALPSRVFNGLLSFVFGIRLHDSNCGYRVMKRHVATGLDLRGNLYRFIPQIAHMQGFRVAEIPVEHRKRQFGSSKFGSTRFWTGLLDILTLRFVSKYYSRPLHFFGSLGLLPFALGVGLEIYALVMKFVFGSTFQTHVAAIVVGIMLILAGTQCILTGLVGEMIQFASGRRDWHEAAKSVQFLTDHTNVSGEREVTISEISEASEVSELVEDEVVTAPNR